MSALRLPMHLNLSVDADCGGSGSYAMDLFAVVAVVVRSGSGSYGRLLFPVVFVQWATHLCFWFGLLNPGQRFGFLSVLMFVLVGYICWWLLSSSMLLQHRWVYTWRR
eukprot:735427_1